MPLPNHPPHLSPSYQLIRPSQPCHRSHIGCSYFACQAVSTRYHSVQYCGSYFRGARHDRHCCLVQSHSMNLSRTVSSCSLYCVYCSNYAATVHNANVINTIAEDAISMLIDSITETWNSSFYARPLYPGHPLVTPPR